MADDGTGDKRNDLARLQIVNGELLVTQPKTAAEVNTALLQHGRLILDAYMDAAALVRYITQQVPEMQRPRTYRILADTWRHLSVEEQAANLLFSYSDIYTAAVRTLTDELARAVTIQSEPISTSKN